MFAFLKDPQPKTVDAIMANFTKTAQELADLAVEENTQAAVLREQAQALTDEAIVREQEALRAVKLSTRIDEFASV